MQLAERVATFDPVTLDYDDALEGLTAKQQLFVRYVFSGLRTVDAYRRAGYQSNANDNTQAKQAYILLQDPMVQEKLRTLRVRAESQSSLAPNLSRDFVLNGIMRLAEGADKDSTRLRAYELLGRTAELNLFRETVVHEHVERTVADVDQELAERLKDLKATIEAKARDVTPPASPPRATPDRRRKPRS